MDERSITYDPETKKIAVKRAIFEEYTEEAIKQIYEAALNTLAKYEREYSATLQLKNIIETLFAFKDKSLTEMSRQIRVSAFLKMLTLPKELLEKTPEDIEEMLKYYKPMMDAEKKKLEELKPIYEKISQLKKEASDK